MFSAQHVDISCRHAGKRSAVQCDLLQFAPVQQKGTQLSVVFHIEERFRKKKTDHSIVVQLTPGVHEEAGKRFSGTDFPRNARASGDRSPGRIGCDVVKGFPPDAAQQGVFAVFSEIIHAEDLRRELPVGESEKKIHLRNEDGEGIIVESEDAFRIMTGQGEQERAAAAAGVQKSFSMGEIEILCHIFRDGFRCVIGAVSVFASFRQHALIEKPENVPFMFRNGETGGKIIRFGRRCPQYCLHMRFLQNSFFFQQRGCEEMDRPEQRDFLPAHPVGRRPDKRNVSGIGNIFQRQDPFCGAALVRPFRQAFSSVDPQPVPISLRGSGDVRFHHNPHVPKSGENGGNPSRPCRAACRFQLAAVPYFRRER